MFRHLRIKLLLFTLHFCVRRKAPRLVPMNESTDFFSVSFAGENSEFFVLESIDGGQLNIVRRNDDEIDTQISLALAELSQYRIFFTHFFGSNAIRYGSLGEFWFSELSLLPHRMKWKASLGQWRFNLSTRFRRERIEVLREIVAVHMRKAQRENPLLFVPSSSSVVSLFADIYGPQVYAHPSFNRESATFRIILDSLVSSGDLEQCALHEFKLSPRSLVTIAEYEQSERRHRESVNLNRMLILLTMILTVSSVVDAFRK